MPSSCAPRRSISRRPCARALARGCTRASKARRRELPRPEPRRARPSAERATRVGREARGGRANSRRVLPRAPSHRVFRRRGDAARLAYPLLGVHFGIRHRVRRRARRRRSARTQPRRILRLFSGMRATSRATLRSRHTHTSISLATLRRVQTWCRKIRSVFVATDASPGHLRADLVAASFAVAPIPPARLP